MIEFESPKVLILVFPLIFAGILYLYFFQKNRFDFLAYLLITILLTITLANPYIFHGEKAIYKKDMEILILLDSSLSMAVNDIKPTRFEVAIKKIEELIKEMKGERIGFLIFSDKPYIVSYPTRKYEQLIKKLKSLKISPHGSTNIVEAISTTNSMLTAKERIIILFSDGGDEDVEKLEKLVLSSSLKLIFYGIATEEGGRVPGYSATSQLNKEIGKIAVKSGGIFIKYSKDNQYIKKISQYSKRISEKTEKLAMKIKEKVYLTPYIALLSMGIISLKFLTKRILITMIVLILFFYQANAGELKGYVYYLLGDYLKASKEFIKEKNPENQYNAAVSMIKAGLYDKAIEVLKRIKTKNVELLKKIKYNLALCYLVKEDYKQAYKLAQELIEYFPQDEKIIKLYRFTNMVENFEKKPERKKTIVKVKEEKSKQFKKSPMEFGERNPW